VRSRLQITGRFRSPGTASPGTADVACRPPERSRRQPLAAVPAGPDDPQDGIAPASAAVDPAGDRLQARIDPQFVRRQLAARAPAAGEGAPRSDRADQVSAASLSSRCQTSASRRCGEKSLQAAGLDPVDDAGCLIDEAAATFKGLCRQCLPGGPDRAGRLTARPLLDGKPVDVARGGRCRDRLGRGRRGRLARAGLDVMIRRGRTGRGSSPWPTPRRSRSRTSPSRRRSRRPPPERAARSSTRTRGRHGCRST